MALRWSVPIPHWKLEQIHCNVFYFQKVILLDLWCVSHGWWALWEDRSQLAENSSLEVGRAVTGPAWRPVSSTSRPGSIRRQQQSSTHRAANLVKNRVHTIVTIQGEKLDLRHIPPSVPQTIPLTWGKVEGHIPINTVWFRNSESGKK